MSRCISHYGKYSEHDIGDDFRCKLCRDLDEEALIADRDAARAERDQARAAHEGIIQRVRELHQALPVYLMADECECPNRDEHEVMEAEYGDLLCMASPTGNRHCRECSHCGDDEPTDHPCPTIRALDAAAQEVSVSDE